MTRTKFSPFELKGALGNIAKGAWYALLLVFFSRLLSFAIFKIEIFLYVLGQDPQYEVLKNGLSFLATWGALLWFTLYSLEDFLLSIVLLIVRGKEIVAAVRSNKDD